MKENRNDLKLILLSKTINNPIKAKTNVIKYDKKYNSSFKITSIIHTNLINNNISSKKDKNLNYLNKNKEYNYEYDNLSNHEKDILEVKSLPKIVSNKSNSKTYEMLLNQKRKRRNLHIEKIKNFDIKIWKFENIYFEKIETIQTNINEKLNILRNNYINKINIYFNEKILLRKEIEIIDEINELKDELISNSIKLLNNLENEIEQNILEFKKEFNKLIKNLNIDLIEIAFKLRDEIELIIKPKIAIYNETLENLNLLREDVKLILFNKILKIKEVMEDKVKLVETEWRKFKHNYELNIFLSLIDSEKFIKPDKLVNKILEYYEYSNSIFKIRYELIFKFEIFNLNEFNEINIQKNISYFNNLYDESNDNYDIFIKKILNIRQDIENNLNLEFDKINKRLKFLNADLEDKYKDLQELISIVIDPKIKFLKEFYEVSIKKTVDFIEKRDKISYNISMNFINIILKISKIFDNFNKEIYKYEYEYEIKKSDIEEEDLETMKQFSDKFDELKIKLRYSKDHIILDQNLDNLYDQLDKIESQFREFSIKNKNIVNEHIPILKNAFTNTKIFVLKEFQYIENNENNENKLKEIYTSIAKSKAKNQILKEESEEEEKAKLHIAQEIEKNKDKKGYKAPVYKPKDPKKLNIERKEKFDKYINDYLKNINYEEFEDFTLIKKFSLKFIIIELLKKYEEFSSEDKNTEEKNIEEKIEPVINKEENIDKNKNKKINEFNLDEINDCIDKEDLAFEYIENDSPLYFNSNIIFFKNNFQFLYEDLEKLFFKIKEGIFNFINNYQNKTFNNSAKNDKVFLESDLILLDKRLKDHYPIKGKIKTEIYSLRDSEITLHKERYQEIIRDLNYDINFQIEEFNRVNKNISLDFKDFENLVEFNINKFEQQKDISSLDILNFNTKKEDFIFKEKFRLNIDFLKDIKNVKFEQIKQKIRDYINSLVLFNKNGNYSENEVEWYNSLSIEIIKDIDEKIQNLENEITELIDVVKDKNSLLLENFNSKFKSTIEDLSALKSLGYKFSIPIKKGNEVLRTEITNCQNAILSIKNLFESVKNDSECYNLNLQKNIFIREKLQSIRICGEYLCKYFDSFKQNSVLNEYIMKTFTDDKLTIELNQTEQLKSEELKINILSNLGKLYFSNSKKFEIKKDEIEKVIKDECSKLYTGYFSKFISSDKLTDHLKEFIQNCKNECDDFKTNIILELKEFFVNIRLYSEIINKNVIEEIYLEYIKDLQNNINLIQEKFNNFNYNNENNKNNNVKRMRPNLNHPDNDEILKELNKEEDLRNIDSNKFYNDILNEFLDYINYISNEFLMKIINNYNFLMDFWNNFILKEDFIKFSHEEDVKKDHLTVKQLLLMKKKNMKFDNTLERNNKINFKGFSLLIFTYNNYKPKFMENIEEIPNNTKKNNKKNDVKNLNQDESEPFETFSSNDQKSLYEITNEYINNFKSKYEKTIKNFTDKIEEKKKNENDFKFYWEKLNVDLFK